MADVRIHPETLAGDPFALAGRKEAPHACWDSFVYVGYMAVDEESGEEIELVRRIPCQRCIAKLEEKQ